jgi:hypothetical protein
MSHRNDGAILPKLVDVHNLHAAFGCGQSLPTFRQRLRRGRRDGWLPAPVRLGRKLYWDLDAVLAAFEQLRVAA